MMHTRRFPFTPHALFTTHALFTPHALFTTCTLAALLLAGVIPAGAQKKPAPSKQQQTTLPAQPQATVADPCRPPAVVADSLPNGLRVLFVRVNDLPLVELNLIIDAGIARDPVSKEGVAQLTGRCTLNRTAARTRNNIARAFAALGSSVSSAVAADHAQLYVRSLARNFTRTVDLMADLCINGSAGDRDVTNEIRAMAAQAARSPMQPGETATLTALTLLAGERDPVVRSATRLPRDLQAVSSADVLEFRRAWYLPNNATLVVTGAVDPAVAMTVLADRFGPWQRGTLPLSPAAPAPVVRQKAVTLLDAQSVNVAPLRIAYDAPQRGSEDFAALIVLNRIVGEGPASLLSRVLWAEHRVHPGFLSSVGGTTDRSYLIISGFSASITIDSVFLFLDAALERLCSGGITEAECDTAKRALLDGYEFDFSTNKRAQSMLQELVISHVPAAPPDRMTRMLQAVSAADVARVARRVFRGAPPAVVVYGNSERFIPVLQRRFGRDVHVVRSRPADGDSNTTQPPTQPPETSPQQQPSPPDQR